MILATCYSIFDFRPNIMSLTGAVADGDDK